MIKCFPKRLLTLLLICLLGFSGTTTYAKPAQATDGPQNDVSALPELGLDCKSAVLMEASTGQILYAINEEEALPPASVTKVMTLLLIMEAIDSGRLQLTDPVTVSANAASMGGSQIYLKEGEQMCVEDLLKSVVIASANDAAVALAEHIYGSVEAFVVQMNEKARLLGMENTSFENVTGLDDAVTKHLTSAKDIATMSRELLRHPTILKYSSIWMDTIRDGAFGLTNTNRLVRFYNGCTGLKTGSTSKAGFCVSATATRNDMTLICVIMGASSRDARNLSATKLLDWGFANYGVFAVDTTELAPLRVLGGTAEQCRIGHGCFSCVLKKEMVHSITAKTELPEALSAPVQKGTTVGRIVYYFDEKPIGEVSVQSLEAVQKISYWGVFVRMLAKYLLI